MDKEAVNAWNPGFRDAFREVLNGDDVIYKTEHDISLEKSSDSEPWQPSEKVKECAPNVEKVAIEMISADTNLNEINQKFIEEGTVGIVLMGQHISRFSKPSLIIMITKTKLYAIHPDDLTRGIKFLRMKLHDTRISFYTTNGLNENDCLHHFYNIDLSLSPNVNCCTGLNIVVLRQLRNTTKVRKSMYPAIAIYKAQSRLKIESFENMVECWLKVPKEDIMFRPNQIIHLSEWPLSLTAKNIIKKRCILVLPLAEELEIQAKRDILDISQIVYNKLPAKEKLTRLIYDDIFKESNPQEAKVRSLLSYLAGIKGYYI